MSNARKIVIPLDQVNEGLRLIASNIRVFIQDHYAHLLSLKDPRDISAALAGIPKAKV
jgi:hypothetical protein